MLDSKIIEIDILYETLHKSDVMKEDLKHFTEEFNKLRKKGDLVISDLLEADEVFLTNVIMLILPVIKVEAHTVGNGKPGQITKKLSEALSKILSDKNIIQEI